MPQYLVAVQNPDNFALPTGPDGQAMIEEIHALNREMIAAGARDFAGGLEHVSKAKTVRKQSSGEVLVSDGPFVEAKEHIGGIWLLTCPDMNAAVEWARKATVACRVPVEVREFMVIPESWKANTNQKA